MPTPPTSTPWVPMWPVGGASIPPVSNGQWLKGVGGAMVWSDIDSDDIKTGRLKTDGQLITDWNTAISDGFYRANNAAANAPVADYCQGIVAQYDTGQVVQEVWALFQQAGGLPAIRYQRRMYSGAWGPWKAIGGVTYNTSLPLGVPVDAQECILVDSLTTPTYHWRFRYNAGSTSAYKWEYIGGIPAQVELATLAVPGGTAVFGASFTLPRSGDYEQELSIGWVLVTNARTAWLSAWDGGADTMVETKLPQSTDITLGFYGRCRQLGKGAGSALSAHYYPGASGPASTINLLRNRVTPIRVG